MHKKAEKVTGAASTVRGGENTFGGFRMVPQPPKSRMKHKHSYISIMMNNNNNKNNLKMSSAQESGNETRNNKKVERKASMDVDKCAEAFITNFRKQLASSPASRIHRKHALPWPIILFINTHFYLTPNV
ncbi:hypothetical protein HID58_036462 [Brassica napus]|uniref:Uncharacterized protein n=1 Tax=Brassica napus TaxID=3708 RepID=A0ABQ8C7T2_BRANA|nr:hypothetical protein HID58_036462 [Brassica napus]